MIDLVESNIGGGVLTAENDMDAKTLLTYALAKMSGQQAATVLERSGLRFDVGGQRLAFVGGGLVGATGGMGQVTGVTLDTEVKTEVAPVSPAPPVVAAKGDPVVTTVSPLGVKSEAIKADGTTVAVAPQVANFGKTENLAAQAAGRAAVVTTPEQAKAIAEAVKAGK